MRSIGFDQQSYEGKKNIYLPQFFKDNVELVNHAQELLSLDMANQYAKEGRVAMKKRFIASRQRTKSLLRRMRKDHISTNKNIITLKNELNSYHRTCNFNDCNTMGDILILHLELKLGVKIFN